jgi:hypothetical protein
MDAAQALAERIVGYDQITVRSAKQTVFDVIGRPLDDQSRIEGLSGYSWTAQTEEILAAIAHR